MTVEAIDIPAVCDASDLARILKLSVRTIQRAVASGTCPVSPLPSFCSHPRWSGEAVRRYLDGQTEARRYRRVG